MPIALCRTKKWRVLWLRWQNKINGQERKKQRACEQTMENKWASLWNKIYMILLIWIIIMEWMIRNCDLVISY